MLDAGYRINSEIAKSEIIINKFLHSAFLIPTFFYPNLPVI
jgi:hypothetical protein